MSLTRRLAYVAVFVSLAWTTVPQLARLSREALRLWPLSPVERRTAIFGDFYDSVRRVRAGVPDREPLALVLERAVDVGPALFLNYYLYPQPAKLYFGLDAYRLDWKGPRRIVRIDVSRSPEARLMTYGAVRAEAIGTTRVVTSYQLPAEARRSFVVPLVSSGDGPPPDSYTTEAAMENPASEAARVAITMYPAGRTVHLTLEAGEHRRWNDLVYQLYGSMDAGWLQVDSDQPLRARFWFVNRAAKDADALELAEFFRSARIDVPVGGKLWVLNPHDRELSVRLNEGQHTLPPRALIPLQWVGGAQMDANDEWYAFVSRQDAAGGNVFRWPGRR